MNLQIDFILGSQLVLLLVIACALSLIPGIYLGVICYDGLEKGGN
jgi:hypothetical protein